MNVSKQLFLGLCVFTLLFMFTPGARASAWDQKVVATFSGPVQIPGQVLQPGTYVFKVPDIGTPYVVQVFNANESRVLATAFAIPRYRSEPTEKPVFVLEERGTDSPQALQAWFYSGYTIGHQFIYAAATRPEAITAANLAAPTTTDSAVIPPAATEESSAAISAEPNTTEPAPEVVTPSATEPDQTAQAPDTSATNSGGQTNTELPKTAGSTPLIALVGMLLLGGAFGLKALASRVS